MGADGEIFDVKIFRAQSSYQFTDRLVLRNISEYNTYDKTLDLNFLAAYRVNSGTVFYIGYDDHLIVTICELACDPSSSCVE